MWFMALYPVRILCDEALESALIFSRIHMLASARLPFAIGSPPAWVLPEWPGCINMWPWTRSSRRVQSMNSSSGKALCSRAQARSLNAE